MRFPINLTVDEDGVWVAEVPSIPGCVSQGATRDEALQNIEEAMALCLEVRGEFGMPLTIDCER
jgi:predicted RNase H-like HicB family nuclease